MSCTRLPLELIDSIFEHLHDDNRALAACSTVCKAWVCPARRHLFADVTLHQEAIKKLVKSKTAAIPFVRCIRIKGFFNLQFWNETFPLLVGFKSVRSLSLECLPWNDMIPNAQSVLLDQFSSVVRLYFYEIEVAEFSQLAQIICSFPRLKTLIIVRASWVHLDPIQSTLCPPHSLRALELVDLWIDDVLKWFLSFERMPPLRTVHLYRADLESFRTLDKFLQALGPSLEAFSYNLDIFRGSNWPISLGHNTCLRSLRVDLSLTSDTAEISQTLSQIVSTYMDEVRFTFFQRPRNDEVEEWDKVDKILTQPLFVALRRVEIIFIIWPGAGPFASQLADWNVWAVNHLPRCSFRGILDVSKVSYSRDSAYL